MIHKPAFLMCSPNHTPHTSTHPHSLLENLNSFFDQITSMAS
jgi:hypothetical protein